MNGFGFEFRKYQWYDFKGKVGGASVSFALYQEEDGKLTGNYCYTRFDKRIQLRGKVQGDMVTLEEFVGNKSNGYFEGRVSTDSVDRLKGIWKDSAGSRTLEFNLVVTAVNSGAPVKKYADFFGSDEEVEGFMKKVKQAIIKSDKVWLADRIKYPLTTYFDGKTTVSVKTKKQFIELFDRIIHPAFRERITGLCACNLFANYRGAMLGNGEIWMNMRPGSTEKKYSYLITALNN